jgi:hypothetical protein
MTAIKTSLDTYVLTPAFDPEAVVEGLSKKTPATLRDARAS